MPKVGAVKNPSRESQQRINETNDDVDSDDGDTLCRSWGRQIIKFQFRILYFDIQTCLCSINYL